MATVERDVRIEPGSSADIDAVMNVMEASFGNAFGEAWTRSQLSGILPMTGVSLSIAREPERGGTIGFSLTRGVADEAELLLLAVHPDHHRSGVGTHLLRNFLERSRNDRLARVHLEVRDGNPAVAMYRSAGFLPVGRRRNYYHSRDGQRFDAVTFSYQL